VTLHKESLSSPTVECVKVQRNIGVTADVNLISTIS